MSKVKKNDICKIKYLSNLKISSDQRYLAVSVSQANEKKDGYTSQVQIFDQTDQQWSPFTNPSKSHAFFFDREKPVLYLQGPREEQDQKRQEEGEEFTPFYALTIGKGEAIKAFEIEKTVSKIRQISEHEFILLSGVSDSYGDYAFLNKEQRRKNQEKKQEQSGWSVIDRIPIWANGAGLLGDERGKVYLYNKKSDTLKNLTDKIDKDLDVQDFEISADAKRMVLTYQPHTPVGSLYTRFLAYDIESSKVLYRYDQDDFMISQAFIKNQGDVVLIAHTGKDYGINENDKIYLSSAKEPSPVCLTPSLDVSFWTSVGSDIRLYGGETACMTEEALYYTTTEGYTNYVYRYDFQNPPKRVLGAKGSIDEIALGDETIFHIGLHNMQPQEVYQGTASPKKISDFQAEYLERRTIIEPEHFTVTDAEGNEIDCFLLRPAGQKPNLKYPVILDIHGGPKTVYGEVYTHEMQYWSAEGFAVLFANPKGSDGKGNAFSDIRGRYGTIDYDNLMQCLDEALKRFPFLDEQRMGVVGGSYGGFMTNWILGHTDRFKAAATQRSISNWISMYGTTDIGYYFATDQTAADPFENPQKMWDASPLKYVQNVKTPTLVVHSAKDYRCWLPEGLQFYTALQQLGVKTRLLLFHEENHELTRSGKPLSRLKSLQEITDWFKEHLS